MPKFSPKISVKADNSRDTLVNLILDPRACMSADYTTNGGGRGGKLWETRSCRRRSTSSGADVSPIVAHENNQVVFGGKWSQWSQWVPVILIGTHWMFHSK